MKSSKGKVYYFHLKTLVNQWVEPADWKQLEEKERMKEEEAAVARLADLQGCLNGQCRICVPSREGWKIECNARWVSSCAHNRIALSVMGFSSW